MKFAICDDEKAIRDYIAGCVREVSEDIEIEIFQDAEGIMSPDFEADILFLDIQMPGTDGMRAARILREKGKKTVIVFVTALPELVFDAFEVDAFRYIVKPFEREKLLETIEKSIHQAKAEKQEKDYSRDNKKYGYGIINIKTDGIKTSVALSEVAFAEVFNRMIVLHMVDGDGNRSLKSGSENTGARNRLAISAGNRSLKSRFENTEAQISYYGRISELEKLAGQNFFRIHRAYLINLKYVRSYDSKHVEILGTEIPVARGKYQDLVKAYLSFQTRMEGL